MFQGSLRIYFREDLPGGGQEFCPGEVMLMVRGTSGEMAKIADRFIIGERPAVAGGGHGRVKLFREGLPCRAFQPVDDGLPLGTVPGRAAGGQVEEREAARGHLDVELGVP